MIQQGVETKPRGSHTVFQPPDLRDVRWTEGFWADKWEVCRENTLTDMRRAVNHPDNPATFHNFKAVAGLAEREHHGTHWSDGDCYKYMEAVSRAYALTGDEALDKELDDLIELVTNAQEPDGYICTQIQLTDLGRWTQTIHHELYNFGHLMTAASVHHRLTGKTNFLDVAMKAADYLYGVFQPRPPELAHYGWNPSNIMGLVDLYRATGKEAYLELAGTFVDMRGSQPGGSDQNQAHVPLREEVRAVGHAVTGPYLWAGATDLYAETGEEELFRALERIWTNMTERRMYLTGGIGSLHGGRSERFDEVYESFGLDYQLFNATAYNETCANISNAMWNWRMLKVTGEAKYADVVERVIYNAGISGLSADGKGLCYTNPLRWYGESHELLKNDIQGRSSVWTGSCCFPQLARTIPHIQEWVYGVEEDGLWVHLYGSNKLETTLPDGTPLNLRQETSYPWDGEVKLTVERVKQGPFSLKLRVPEWATGTSIMVNGEASEVAPVPGSYTEIKRQWSAGDEVVLNMPMPPRLVRSHPRVEANRNHVAVMRGPLVYCLESDDLPDGVGVSDVYFPLDLELTPRFDPNLFNGVTVLEGVARRKVAPSDKTQELYSAADPLTLEALDITLIPYFAWNNRTFDEMIVWLPVA